MTADELTSELLSLCADPEWAARTIAEQQVKLTRIDSIIHEYDGETTDNPWDALSAITEVLHPTPRIKKRGGPITAENHPWRR